MTIAEEVKTIRKKLGMSMEDFSKRIGVSKTSISFWESGIKEPSAKNLEAVRDIGKSLNLNLNLNQEIDKDFYSTCKFCKYEKIEKEFNYCPICSDKTREIKFNSDYSMFILLNFYHVDKLIAEAEDELLNPHIEINKKRNFISEPISNKEEAKAIKYAERAGTIKWLEEVKKKVPIVLDCLSEIEHHVIDLLYCSSDRLRKSYTEVEKITGIDYSFLKKTDLKVRKLIAIYFEY